MNTALLRAILILPGNVLVVVPALVLWLSGWSAAAWQASPATFGALALAAGLAGLGLMLMVRTVGLFLRRGQGTPAPWDPPRKLVVEGVYRHVRNPMISGVICALLAEALAFWSWPLCVWAALFVAVNMLYMPLSEEPGLERRFGAAYRTYKANVPRWIPRFRPWAGEDLTPDRS
ncbi:MAG: isoprenylcysteine carboxylmethyltransferase family protein [Rhodospirillales bacterium]|nr:isoprenylcysteine carboxylmethyltransferase family protein [Rhodospirillales bacterium]MDH3967834.1 isoprenylcysteine carboxylmethyltransferase family protein [Rhodospirillales bacterium]